MMDSGQQRNSTLYEEFGGDKEVSELIDGFYYKVLMDKTLRKFYLHADMSHIRYQQKRFFGSFLGSDQIYGGRLFRYLYQFPRDMYEAHKHANVKDVDFDKFKSHLLVMLKDKQKSQHIIDYIMDRVEQTRKLIVIPQSQETK